MNSNAKKKINYYKLPQKPFKSKLLSEKINNQKIKRTVTPKKMLSKFTSSALLLASLSHAIQLSASADLDSSWVSFTGSEDATELTRDQFLKAVCADPDNAADAQLTVMFDSAFDKDKDGVCSKDEYAAAFAMMNAHGLIDDLLKRSSYCLQD